MKKIEKFVADDGKEFLTEDQCLQYEESIKLPLPKENIDWTQLINLAKEYIKSINDNEDPSDDSPQYFFEEVISTIYGNSIWTWINKRI